MLIFIGIAFPTTNNTNIFCIEDVIIRNNNFIGANIFLNEKLYNILIDNNYFTDNIILNYPSKISTFISSYYTTGIVARNSFIRIQNNSIKLNNENLNGIRLESYLLNSIINNNKIKSNLKGKSGINSFGKDNIINNNIIDNFNIGMSIGCNQVINNKIDNCNYGIDTKNTSFLINQNYFNNCTYGIRISSIITDTLSEISENKFNIVLNRCILCNVNMNSHRILIKQNSDYFDSETTRNLIEVVENMNVRANLFNNYKCRKNSYTWVDNNELDL